MFFRENPNGWLFKANHYFQVYQIPSSLMILTVSFYVEGEALVWFQDAEDSGIFTSWDSFVKALLLRFGDSPYDDPMESMKKLRQMGSVADYKSQFESLSSILREVSYKIKLSCFIGGLKDEIRYPIRLLNPAKMHQAFGLAKLQEQYVQSSRKRGQSASWGASGTTVSGGVSAPTRTNSNFNFPMQRISRSQMKESRKRGLCYNCDEKWYLGHKCKTTKLFVQELEDEIITNNEVLTLDLPLEVQSDAEMVEVDFFQISLQVVTGHPHANQ